MRFLADENIDKLSVQMLREAGHDVFYVREINPSEEDPSLLSQATREQRTLLTYDKGFSELIVRRGFRAPYGVILFRLTDELPRVAKASLIFGAATIREEWPPGIWTVHLRHAS